MKPCFKPSVGCTVVLLVLDLMAQGYNMQEIAKRINQKPKWVYEKAVPEIVKTVTRFIQETGKDATTALKIAAMADEVCAAFVSEE